MKKLMLFYFSLFVTLSLFSQTRYEILKKNVFKADTVFVIDFQNHKGEIILHSSDLIQKSYLALSKKGKFLTTAQKKELAAIIARPDHPKGKFTVSNPDPAAQAIMLKHEGKCFFIEISSSSRKMIPSPEFGIDSFILDFQKEISLENFFYKIGLKRQD